MTGRRWINTGREEQIKTSGWGWTVEERWDGCWEFFVSYILIEGPM